MAISKEFKIITINEEEVFIEGYFLTIEHLKKIVRDFQVDCYDGFVSNDHTYLELKLKKMDYEK